MNRRNRFVCTVLMLCMLLTAATAYADDALDFLKPIWLNAIEDMQQETKSGQPEELVYAEPAVSCADERFEIVRSAVYMDDEYSTQADVYAELRNVSSEIQYVREMGVNVLDAGGKTLAEKDYAAYAPDIVYPGKTIVVKEWLYDFVSDLSKVSEMEIVVELSKYTHGDIAYIDGAQAYVQDGYLICEIRNETQEPLYELGGVAIISDAQGKILDILMESTYSAMGLGAQSSLLLRRRIEEHAQNAAKLGVACEAWAYQKLD